MKGFTIIYNIFKINFLSALKEAFISLLPFIVLSSMLTLFANLLRVFDISAFPVSPEQIEALGRVLNTYLPTILLISLSFHIAKKENISILISIILSLVIFISLQSLTTFSIHFKDLTFIVFFIPFTTVLLLQKLNYLTNYFNNPYLLSNHLSRTLYYLLSFIIIYFFSLFIYTWFIFSFLSLDLTQVFTSFSNDVLFIFRIIIGQLLWFIGIHPSHTIDTILGINSIFHQDVFVNLTYAKFYNLFLIVGGAGMGISLLIALFISTKEKETRYLAKIATPFVIFNINEILIFGLPLVFNRYLLIPFLLVPLVNTAIVYTFLSIYPIEFSTEVFSWITPSIINIYLQTNGSLAAVFLQIIVIFVGVLIYLPFLRHYLALQSSSVQREKLYDKLNVLEGMSSKEGIKSYEALNNIIRSNDKIDEIIKLISDNNMSIYYQPKVNIETNTCEHYEALLRLELADGKVVGPYFLEDIENSGMASVIDFWVCKQVLKDLNKWEEINFFPKVSINLHPDTLEDQDIISQIIFLLKGKDIDFELIERSFLEDSEAIHNLKKLKENNFTLSLDDFGTGYSSLTTLITLPFNYIKLDKSLIDFIETPKGYAICENTAQMCEELGLVLIAEGVENKEQLKLIKEIGIIYVQGYVFSPAIPFEKVYDYHP